MALKTKLAQALTGFPEYVPSSVQSQTPMIGQHAVALQALGDRLKGRFNSYRNTVAAPEADLYTHFLEGPTANSFAIGPTEGGFPLARALVSPLALIANKQALSRGMGVTDFLRSYIGGKSGVALNLADNYLGISLKPEQVMAHEVGHLSPLFQSPIDAVSSGYPAAGKWLEELRANALGAANYGVHNLGRAFDPSEYRTFANSMYSYSQPFFNGMSALGYTGQALPTMFGQLKDSLRGVGSLRPGVMVANLPDYVTNVGGWLRRQLPLVASQAQATGEVLGKTAGKIKDYLIGIEDAVRNRVRPPPTPKEPLLHRAADFVYDQTVHGVLPELVGGVYGSSAAAEAHRRTSPDSSNDLAPALAGGIAGGIGGRYLWRNKLRDTKYSPLLAAALIGGAGGIEHESFKNNRAYLEPILSKAWGNISSGKVPLRYEDLKQELLTDSVGGPRPFGAPIDINKSVKAFGQNYPEYERQVKEVFDNLASPLKTVRTALTAADLLKDPKGDAAKMKNEISNFIGW